MIPTDNSTFTDEDIIEILNEEMDTRLLFTLTSLHEEHMVRFTDIATDPDTARYTIPYRAIGNKLRDVAYVDSSGAVYEMSRISLEEVTDYRYYRSNTGTDVFYVEGDEIVLVDTRLKDYPFVRMHYYLRPNVLIKTADAGVITGIDRNTGVITLSSVPSTFGALPEMDFVQKRTPNKIHSFDKTPTAVDQTLKTITFATADIPTDLVVGDYICVAEQSPVPNIPTELHPLLAQHAAIHILESLGDTEGLGNAMRRLQDMEKSIQGLIDDRVEGAPQKINPRHTPLSSSTSRNYRRRYRN
jgi:hypothetical protein